MSLIQYLKISVIVLIAGIISYYYIDYNNIKNKLAISIKNEKILKDSIKTKNEEMKQLRINIEEIQNINKQLVKSKEKMKIDLKNLEDKFKRADKKSLEELSLAKPKLIENIINKSSLNVLMCLEKSTGAKGLEYEILNCN